MMPAWGFSRLIFAVLHCHGSLAGWRTGRPDARYVPHLLPLVLWLTCAFQLCLQCSAFKDCRALNGTALYLLFDSTV